jgi:hypothetical protein
MSDKLPTAADQSGQLLERALASYTPAQPRPGFEDRIHVRIAAAAQSLPSRSGLTWIWAPAAALAVVLLVMGLLRFHTQPAPSNLDAHQLRSRPSVPPSGPPRIPALAHASTKKQLTPSQKPARPASVTTQEQMIAQLLANRPEAVAYLAKAADQPEKPLEIKPLLDDPMVIEPIQIRPLDDNPADPGERF